MFLQTYQFTAGQVPVSFLDGPVVYARKIPAVERDRLISSDGVTDRMQFELFLERIVDALRALNRSVSTITLAR